MRFPFDSDAREAGTMNGILLDLDGVIYIADEPIPGAAEAVGALQRAGIPYRFLTNTSTLSRDDLVARLASHGIESDRTQIITPAFAAASWLRDRGSEGVALFVREAAATEFEDLPLLPESAERGADTVVIGDLGAAWNGRTLDRAFRLLHANPAATLVALGMTRYWQDTDGLRLDVAPYVRALEYAVERRAVVLGKPDPAFFQVAIDALGVPPRQIAMIGDNVRTDVGAAQRLGLRGILVRTGGYRPGDLQRGVIPDAVLDSVADLPAWWQEHVGEGSAQG